MSHQNVSSKCLIKISHHRSYQMSHQISCQMSYQNVLSKGLIKISHQMSQQNISSKRHIKMFDQSVLSKCLIKMSHQNVVSKCIIKMFHQPFNHSTIPTFSYIPLFIHSYIPIFQHFSIPLSEAEKLKTFRRADFCVQIFPDNKKVPKFKFCNKKGCKLFFLEKGAQKKQGHLKV